MSGKTVPKTVDAVLAEFGLGQHTPARCPSHCNAVWPCDSYRLAAELLTTAQQLAASREQLTAAERALDNIAQSVGASTPYRTADQLREVARVALAAIYGGDAR